MGQFGGAQQLSSILLTLRTTDISRKNHRGDPDQRISQESSFLSHHTALCSPTSCRVFVGSSARAEHSAVMTLHGHCCSSSLLSEGLETSVNCCVPQKREFLLPRGQRDLGGRHEIHCVHCRRCHCSCTYKKKNKTRGSAWHPMRNVGLAVPSCVSKPRSITGKCAVKCCL